MSIFILKQLIIMYSIEILFHTLIPDIWCQFHNKDQNLVENDVSKKNAPQFWSYYSFFVFAMKYDSSVYMGNEPFHALYRKIKKKNLMFLTQ